MVEHGGGTKMKRYGIRVRKTYRFTVHASPLSLVTFTALYIVVLSPSAQIFVDPLAPFRRGSLFLGANKLPLGIAKRNRERKRDEGLCDRREEEEGEAEEEEGEGELEEAEEGEEEEEQEVEEENGERASGEWVDCWGRVVSYQRRTGSWLSAAAGVTTTTSSALSTYNTEVLGELRASLLPCSRSIPFPPLAVWMVAPVLSYNSSVLFPRRRGCVG